ncbi:MAG: prolyl oligopeptidase family serine peptidase [Usitatibacteraceae bacterium]
MTNLIRCGFLAAVFCLHSAGVVADDTRAARAPVADFFRQPEFTASAMSPSGRYVAITMKTASRNRNALVVIDTNNLGGGKALAGFVNADILDVQWVNEDQLVFSVFDLQAPMADQGSPPLYTVDREGKGPARLLIRGRLYSSDDGRGHVRPGFADAGLTALHRFHSVLRDGSSDIVILRLEINDRYEPIGSVLLRLDTVTGTTKVISRGAPDFVFRWALDHSGAPRVAVSHHDGRARLHWRGTVDAAWTKVSEWSTFSVDRKQLTPMFVDSAKILYAAAFAETGKDTSMLAKLDMSQPPEQMKAMLALDGYDFDGSLTFRGSEGTLLGIHYLSDARGTHWLAPNLKAMQAKIDGLLPGRINQLDCGDCKDNSRVLVTSFADRVPPVLYLFDVKLAKLTALSQSRPWLKPETMARREMRRIPARDGLSIPIHITRPRADASTMPLATIVLVHAEPYSRGGEWRWYAESQFLASRGYLVIEPEYRGSDGFGASYQRAGFKQWGLKMQDDIADATEWAVKQKLADSSRICIAGRGYGGYAALMGLIRYPELYRCGLSWSAMTDLDLLYTARGTNDSAMWKDYGLPALVGDRDTDRDQFTRTSPVKQAAKLTQPLLIAHGERDKRVTIQHADALRKALGPHNKQVEWVKYDTESDLWLLESTNIDFWTRVETFLGKQLGGGRQ